MSGWSAPFAKRVLDSWAAHSKNVGAEAVADRIRHNIRAKLKGAPTSSSEVVVIRRSSQSEKASQATAAKPAAISRPKGASRIRMRVKV